MFRVPGNGFQKVYKNGTKSRGFRVSGFFFNYPENGTPGFIKNSYMKLMSFELRM